MFRSFYQFKKSPEMKSLTGKFLKVFILVLLFAIKGIAQTPEPENLKVFDNWVEWSNGSNMLQLTLNRQAYRLLDEREKEITALKTGTDWKTRQAKVKTVLSEIVGTFPEKTPLNPVVTGTLKRGNFRVEKIVFESVPGFRVTGCLFIPDGPGKKPAILNVIGHSLPSFRRDIYQHLILNLVNKGFIVFAIDPVGQGERLQYSDSDLKLVQFTSSTQEHTFMANQCFLSGNSLAKYFIWDGIRAIDYLLTRKEVDPDRIGLTGLSGGGTQTAFIAAFDDRIKAAAPTCYITGYRRLLESIGSQDGEQNLYHGLLKGIDHADLLEVRAPKPVLIVSTTRDFFSIQGARETFQEVRKAYEALRNPDNISMSEGDLGHGFIKNNNEATYAFFQKELNLPGDPAEIPVQYFAENELQVTSAGQGVTSFGGKTVFDLNKTEVTKMAEKLELSRTTDPHHLDLVREKARELSGYQDPGNEVRPVFRGRYQREGYAVELYALETGNRVVVPLLVMRPEKGNSKALLYIHPEGKEAEAAPGGKMEYFVRQGYTVVAPDLPGIGETLPKINYPGALSYGAQLIGRSLVAIHAGEIVRVARFVKNLPGLNAQSIQAFTSGELCPALLHAAVFEPVIGAVALTGSPVSYVNIATTRFNTFSLSFSWGVSGALTAFDLPDLAASIAPRRLLYINTLDASGELASDELIKNQMAFPKAIYSNSESNKLLFLKIQEEKIQDTLADWLGSE
jgi:dienelactone hydrolase